MSNLGDVIASGWERRAELGPGRVDAKLKDAIERVIADLDAGTLRVAEKRDGEWVVNEEAKAAILEYFRVRKVEPVEVGPFEYLDKIPLKHDHAERGVIVSPGEMFGPSGAGYVRFALVPTLEECDRAARIIEELP